MRLRTMLFAPILALHCTEFLPPRTPAPPRLTVVLVVDQMRGDYLAHYGSLFDGGLARLLEEGAVFTNAVQDHAATVTAVGHSTIATGVYPARHGIVGNEFFERAEGRVVDAVDDPATDIVGAPESPGVSPIRLRRTALGDWLRENRPGSIVYSAALKDGSAILLGGRSPTGSYWYDPEARGLVTSTYYADELPDWLAGFAPGGPEVARLDAVASAALHEGWESARIETPSSAAHEYREYAGGGFADDVILRFAAAAIAQGGLGGDDVPDLLLLSASSADDIGHRYGPYSPEVREYYLALDRYLGGLFAFLDRAVGRDRWAFALSSDHGAALPPDLLDRLGLDGRRIPGKEYASETRSAVAEVLAGLPPDRRPQVRWLDGPHLISGTGSGELAALRDRLASRFEDIGFVSRAFTADELERTDLEARGLAGRFGRSFHAGRSPDVLLHLERRHIVGETPGVHGSAYFYDMHVPMAFMGPGIESGTYDRRVRTVDLAPTLARLMGVRPPADLDGRVLREIAR